MYTRRSGAADNIGLDLLCSIGKQRAVIVKSIAGLYTIKTIGPKKKKKKLRINYIVLHSTYEQQNVSAICRHVQNIHFFLSLNHIIFILLRVVFVSMIISAQCIYVAVYFFFYVTQLTDGLYCTYYLQYVHLCFVSRTTQNELQFNRFCFFFWFESAISFF